MAAGRGYPRCVGELSGSGRIRASDAERHRVAGVLAAAFGEGRLDVAEYDARVAACYQAVYRDELIRLLDELPPVDKPLFDIKPAVPVPSAVPQPVPLGKAVEPERRRPYGWPVVLFLFAGALCLARFGMFGPFAVLLLLAGVATTLIWIQDDAGRRGRRPRH
jgi:hypothetical protein